MATTEDDLEDHPGDGVDTALVALARGQPDVARGFRDALTTLRGATTDPGFHSIVDDVLAGRLPPRALARSAAFDRVIAPRLQQAMAVTPLAPQLVAPADE